MQGVFSIKATPLGANSVLLEDVEEGVLEEMVRDKNWIYEWFEEIYPWEPFVADNERLVWVRCHGIPPHAWGEGICKLLANTMGSFVDVDEDTRKKTTLDIARIMIRTRSLGVICETFYVTINERVFPIKMVEEWCGPLRWTTRSQPPVVENSDSEEEEEVDSDDEVGDGPPLFSPEMVEVEDDGKEVEETQFSNDEEDVEIVKNMENCEAIMNVGVVKNMENVENCEAMINFF